MKNLSLADFQGTILAKAYQTEELEKAREGSRGGKVIGHTKSGKAIYSDHINKLADKIHSKPNGQERTVNDSIHHGVGAHPYAYKTDLKESGVKHEEGKNPLFGHLTDKEETKKHLAWLEKKHGHVAHDSEENDLEKAEKDAYELLGLKLEKAGEGSKGGKVIGHTKSGKPVYEKFNHSAHKDFTPDEHMDANLAHKNRGEEGEKHLDAASAAIAHEYHYGSKQHTPRTQETIDKRRRTIELNKQSKLAGVKKADDAYALLGLEFQKAGKGEGSKGGHVIGHTRSGKPIYDHASIDYPKFSAQDHKDAAMLHSDLQQSHVRKYHADPEPREENKILSLHHGNMARAHLNEAHAQIQAEHESGLSESEKKIIAKQRAKEAGEHKYQAEHHGEMFKITTEMQKNHQPGSSRHAALQQEAERHLAMFQKHDGEHKRLMGK